MTVNRFTQIMPLWGEALMWNRRALDQAESSGDAASINRARRESAVLDSVGDWLRVHPGRQSDRTDR